VQALCARRARRRRRRTFNKAAINDTGMREEYKMRYSSRNGRAAPQQKAEVTVSAPAAKILQSKTRGVTKARITGTTRHQPPQPACRQDVRKAEAYSQARTAEGRQGEADAVA